MPDFEKLAAWKHAHRVALNAYKLSQQMPPQERYALTDQIRRCASSIPTNIAEGCGRGTDSELAYFLRVALGSAAELQSLMLLARDLEYIAPADLTGFWSQTAEAVRVIDALHERVRRDLDCN
jgi:four helix bundle protein